VGLSWKTVVEVMNERARCEQERKVAAREPQAAKTFRRTKKQLTEKARSQAERLGR
jgi:hypothetical protein